MSERIDNGQQNDFLQTQYEKSVDAYQKQVSLFTQISTVLMVANVTLIGFAFSSQSGGIFFAGALFPLMILYMITRFRKMMLPYLYMAVTIEDIMGSPTSDQMLSTYLATNVSVERLDQLREISNEEDREVRLDRLRRVYVPIFGGSTGLGRTVLIIACLGQIVAPFLLAQYFNWDLLFLRP